MTNRLQRHIRRGFSMVEMIVVIGVLLLLAALLVAVFPAVANTAKTNETKSVLTILGMAVEEWSLSADRQLTYGENDNDFTFDLQTDTPAALTTTELLAIVMRTSTGRNTIGTMEEKYLYQFDTDQPAPKWIHQDLSGAALTIYEDNQFSTGVELTGKHAILDGWGNPILVVHPGQSDAMLTQLGEDPICRDVLDRTQRTSWEIAVGSAVNREIAFVSAGGDKKFGNLHLDLEKYSDLSDDQVKEAELANDNIASYELDNTRCDS